MSRRNAVNKDHYTMRGSLRTDDIARERRNQQQQLFGETRGPKGGPLPPWMANDANSAAGAGGDDAAQRPQGKARPNAQGKMARGGSDEKKAERRTRERTKQETRTGTTQGARSSKATPRSTPKASGATGTPRGGKAPKARGSAARGGSPQRAAQPGAHKKRAAGGTTRRTGKSAAAARGSGAKGANKSTGAKRARKAKNAKKAKKR